MAKLFLPLFFCILFFQQSIGQTPVTINDRVKQHIFSYSEIECLEDANSKYTLPQITGKALSNKFKPSSITTPKNDHLQSAYWYRIRIKQNAQTKNDWILEFFDQTIDQITVYSPISNNHYAVQQFGNNYLFSNRFFTIKTLL